MKKSLGLVFFPAFDWMISATHPERKERLLYTRDQLMEEGIFDLPQIQEYKPELATLSDIERVHVGPTLQQLVTKAHLVSAGGCITAAKAVINQHVDRSFALVRPPGHHAMRVVHGIRGFCTINIESVMIEYLRQHYGIKKVAIVDTDVHHGDGTQEIYYNDPNTLFISFHQDGRTLYPGSGFIEELGTPYAFGSTINLPLLPETGDEGIHLLFDGLIKPILDDFQPDLIINSAGQDNHFTDPLASMTFTAQGYARLADKLQADIAVLEGGYSVQKALPYINTGIILAMAGLDYSKVIEPQAQSGFTQPVGCSEHIRKLINEVSEVWVDRDIMRQKLLHACRGQYTQHKHLYYDETGISENQLEVNYYCEHCPGYTTITSKASNTISFIVLIPLCCCAKCCIKGYDIAHQAKKSGNYTHVFTQDRLCDNLLKM